MASPTDNYKVIAVNKRGRFDYEILETMEAGIQLTGSEVKSLRRGSISIMEAHAGDMQGELYLFNANIPEYMEAHQFNHEPKRPRKLLLRKKQRDKLLTSIQRKGLTIIPLKMYFNQRGKVKVEIALGRGKNVVDKRNTLKDRDWKRDQARLMRNKG